MSRRGKKICRFRRTANKIWRFAGDRRAPGRRRRPGYSTTTKTTVRRTIVLTSRMTVHNDKVVTFLN